MLCGQQGPGPQMVLTAHHLHAVITSLCEWRLGPCQEIYWWVSLVQALPWLLIPLMVYGRAEKKLDPTKGERDAPELCCVLPCVLFCAHIV